MKAEGVSVCGDQVGPCTTWERQTKDADDDDDENIYKNEPAIF